MKRDLFAHTAELIWEMAVGTEYPEEMGCAEAESAGDEIGVGCYEPRWPDEEACLCSCINDRPTWVVIATPRTDTHIDSTAVGPYTKRQNPEGTRDRDEATLHSR